MIVRRLLCVAPHVVAIAMAVIVVVPANAWRPPTDDATYAGFDRNLMYTRGSVEISPNDAALSTAGTPNAIMNLATTVRSRLAVQVDVDVVQNLGAREPFRIGVWSPWSQDGYFIAFGAAPADELSAERVTHGTAGPTLVGGTVSDTPLGAYQLGGVYRIRFDIDRRAGRIAARVSGNLVTAAATLDKAEQPALFGSGQISLTASADGTGGSSVVALTNFRLTLPHERSFASRVDDSTPSSIVIALALLGIASVVVSLFYRRRHRRVAPHAEAWSGLPRRWFVFGAIAYLAGNVLLVPLAGHPFDFANEQFYAYVANAYGPTQLYFLPDVVSFPQIWGGVPWVQAAFPYEPVTAYLFTAIGWIASLLSGGGGISLATPLVGYVIKSTNVVFGLADGALIYLILKAGGVGERWGRAGALMFLFNPAVWFSVAVWGQTHVISTFFALAAILFAQRRMPTWAWLSLSAACLTRPQMLVFGVLLGVVFLRKFAWRENALSLSLVVIVTFIVLTPFMLATSPSLPIDVMLNVAHVQQGGGNQATLTTVSQGAYSIWPVVTYALHGASSLGRIFTQSQQPLVGPISYETAGQILTSALLLFVIALLVPTKRTELEGGGYLPAVALGVAGFLMLLTGIVSTHFVLALPLLVLCRRWMDPIAYVFIVTIWTVSTFVPMFGDMGVALIEHPGFLSPQQNPVTHFFVVLYSWDRFITVAVSGNVCAVVWLGVLALRSGSARTAPSI